MEWLLVAIVTTALVAALSLSRATERLDNVIFDTLSPLTVRAPDDDIVIVAIDNRSIAEIGRWPWGRETHTALLDQISAAGPRAIAYDVLFVEPSDHDEALAAAMRGSPVFLPATFEVPGSNGAAYDLLPPVETLRKAAAGLGQVNVHFDSDGVVRRTYLTERDGQQVWPHLMSAMLAATLTERRSAPPPRLDQTSRGALVREDPLMISFAGPPGHFRTISFVDALNGGTPRAFFQDKLVLVGATADGLGDQYATPLSNHTEIMSGIELQANLLDTLLGGHAIKPIGPPVAALLSLVPLLLALAGFLFLRPRANLLLGGALIALTLAASGVLFVAHFWAPPTAALAGLLLAYPLWSWRRLEATNAYMMQELEDFAREPDLLSALSDPHQAALTDVVDRRMTLLHRAIQRTRNLRRLVLDALQGLPDATLVASLDGQVLIANREAEALFGPAGQVGAASVTELIASLAPETELPPAADDGPPTAVELNLPDGRAFHVLRTALTQAGGEPAGWVVRFTDITALKAAGRQRERILELLTHDMRSPQISILTLLGGAGAEALSADTAGRISGYARRTLSLADNFVNLARAETGSYALEPINLSDVLLDAVDDLWPQSSARGIEVAVIGAEDELLVDADRSLLTRAFINLVDNAIKYSPDDSRIECRLSAGPNKVLCSIADQGRGMTPDQVANLFKRFARIGGDRVDGVGLGLSFVHAVVHRHGGTISCVSAPGAGAAFHVGLPLASG
jgi:CHASE2 domain-containing sensor protein/signal transduction histidine kinase